MPDAPTMRSAIKAFAIPQLAALIALTHPLAKNVIVSAALGSPAPTAAKAQRSCCQATPHVDATGLNAQLQNLPDKACQQLSRMQMANATPVLAHATATGPSPAQTAK
jgi:hypothetical protein